MSPLAILVGAPVGMAVAAVVVFPVFLYHLLAGPAPAGLPVPSRGGRRP
jgi:hypothetical protein